MYSFFRRFQLYLWKVLKILFYYYFPHMEVLCFVGELPLMFIFIWHLCNSWFCIHFQWQHPPWWPWEMLIFFQVAECPLVMSLVVSWHGRWDKLLCFLAWWPSSFPCRPYIFFPWSVRRSCGILAYITSLPIYLFFFFSPLCLTTTDTPKFSLFICVY